jgi:ribosome maturation factor RimP
MVEEAAKKNKEWSEFIGKQCKLVYEDGTEKDGSPHYSTKKGTIIKATKTHLIMTEEGKTSYTAINLFKILRAEIENQFTRH